MALEAAGAPPVPMSRFRPNIVLAASPAGAEDHHRRSPSAEALTLTLVKRCDRCVVTTIDQGSGVRTGKEPLATLQADPPQSRARAAPGSGRTRCHGSAGKATAKLRVGDLCMLARTPEADAAFRHQPEWRARSWNRSGSVPLSDRPQATD